MTASTLPLADKFQIKPGMDVFVISPPEGFDLGPLPDGAVLAAPGAGPYAAIVAFASRAADVALLAPIARHQLKADGLLWFCYPKKSSGAATDLSRDAGWAPLDGLGFRPVRAVSIDATWSGLRFREKAKAGK